MAEAVADRLVEAAGGEIPEEWRLMTALFADVSGFTALADRLDPEELLEVIDPVVGGLSSIVGHYGGLRREVRRRCAARLFGAPRATRTTPSARCSSRWRCTGSSQVYPEICP